MAQIIRNKFILCATLFFLFTGSCNKTKTYTIKYLQNKRESIINNPIVIFDSIVVMYTDSIQINRFLGKINHPLLLNIKNGNAYNYAFRYENLIPASNMLIRVDTLLMFSNKDTIYESLFHVRNIPVVRAFSDASCKITIQNSKNPGERMTIKQSLIDTTYEEIYYYNRVFFISKIINKWQDNICVYE